MGFFDLEGVGWVRVVIVLLEFLFSFSLLR